jgi:hypothetical protein
MISRTAFEDWIADESLTREQPQVSLAEVAMLLGASFLGNLSRILGTRPLIFFLALVRRLLVGLCIGSFLVTYTLNSLDRQEKQIHAHGVIPFLCRLN